MKEEIEVSAHDPKSEDGNRKVDESMLDKTP
jgi:hypothetical protein